MNVAIATLVAQAEQAAPLEALDPPRRTMVLMALLGLVLVGVAMIACVMIAGRWTRRIARDRVKPRDWSQEPKPWEVVAERIGDASDVRLAADDSIDSGETRIDPPPDDTIDDR